MTELLIATHNPGKLREFLAIFDGLGLTLRTLDEVNVGEDIEETGETFVENARLKAEGYAALTGLPTLADDSGLEVAALNGAPGVYSARYGGLKGAAQLDYLLKQLEGVPWNARLARFVCVIALKLPDRDAEFVEGTLPGVIELAPRGTGGFGYDPLFYLLDEDKTLAELPEARKNQMSHRAAAARAARDVLERWRSEGLLITVTSLASGSGGNALLIKGDAGALLVDCGLPQRTIERQLRYVGMEPAGLTAILLTHEHGDHAGSAGPMARRWGLPVVCNGPTRRVLGAQLDGAQVIEWEVGGGGTIGAFHATTFAIPHDAAAPVGYLIDAGPCCVGVAVDLGSWDEHVVSGLRAADLLVVEANHDRERLLAAPYPWSIRHRIMSDRGHLDNVQAGALLARIGDDGRTRDVWLAHLSEHANSPEIAVRMVGATLRMAGVGAMRLAALPRKRAQRWSSDMVMQQQALFDW